MKWEQLKQFAAAMLDEIRTDGAPNAAFREAVVTLAVEIHGDLDQIAISQHKIAQLSGVVVEHWKTNEAFQQRSEKRAEELHVLVMESQALAIAREHRQIAQDMAYQKKYGLTEETADFLRKILGDKSDDAAK